ncbi:MAG: lipid II:glycine glycyltransferase FemX [Alkalispirochaeta sp.]
MSVLSQIPLNHIYTPDNLMQSRIWGIAKRGADTTALAFETPDSGTLLVLVHSLDGVPMYASVPWGPEPPPELRAGTYIEGLSEELRPFLPRTCIFIRYDLPWTSPWEEDETPGPSIATRELEMNFGTTYHRLRKAPTDIRPVHTLVVDINRDDQAILAGMKAKTRYNVGLADRRGVRVFPASPRRLDEWYSLYTETMARHGKCVHHKHHFTKLFEAARQARTAGVLPGTPRKRHNIRLILAEQEDRVVAGMVLAVSGPYAIYLYGASASVGRSAMPTYLLQWQAMRTARRLGAERYDMFGVPPDRREGHPMHGLLRFKEGFGGHHVARRGCWDYPYDERAYSVFAGREAADRGYHH